MTTRCHQKPLFGNKSSWAPGPLLIFQCLSSRFMGSQRVGHDWVIELKWSSRKEISLELWVASMHVANERRKLISKSSKVTSKGKDSLRPVLSNRNIMWPLNTSWICKLNALLATSEESKKKQRKITLTIYLTQQIKNLSCQYIINTIILMRYFLFACCLWNLLCECVFNFYWNIIDLQCCVNLRCTTKWFNYTYVYIHNIVQILFPYRLLKILSIVPWVI